MADKPPPLVKSEKSEKPTIPKEESKTFLSSPWFWGALGAAVAGSLAVYAATRDSSTQSAPVRIDWGGK